MKMKRLLPSLREKKRYVVFEVTSNSKREEILKSIECALRDFLGILGMSKASPVIMKDKFNGKRGIVRFNNPFKDEVITALSLVKGIKVVGISGILKKAESKFEV